jgi:hypothetical protein
MATEKTTLLERLSTVQTALKVPKGQRNTFGNYNYRNAEDILEAVKPLLAEHGLILTLSDELVQVGDRYYVKATAAVHMPDSTTYGVAGYAREEETKKGMDGSQITGASSSYARKYALNGLFLIDDTKDSDATNDHGKESKPAASQKPVATTPGLINPESKKKLWALLQTQGITDPTEFFQLSINKEAPTSEAEVQKLIAELEA